MSNASRKAYGRMMHGLTRPGVYRFMTLTSSLESTRPIRVSFRLLVQRLRRTGKFEYASVREFTVSGLQHLHIVYRGDWIPQSWLSEAWDKIHKAYIVDIRMVRQSGYAAKYLCKYLAKAAGERLSSSLWWIYPGWRRTSKLLWYVMSQVHSYGHVDLGLRLWAEHLRGETLWCKFGLIAKPEIMSKWLKELPGLSTLNLSVVLPSIPGFGLTR